LKLLFLTPTVRYLIKDDATVYLFSSSYFTIKRNESLFKKKKNDDDPYNSMLNDRNIDDDDPNVRQILFRLDQQESSLVTV